MRYVIQTVGNDNQVGIQIKKWQEARQVEVIERSETFVHIEANLARVASALESLKKVGYNSDVIKVWIYDQTKVPKRDIDKVLYEQRNFLRQIGAIK